MISQSTFPSDVIDGFDMLFLFLIFHASYGNKVLKEKWKQKKPSEHVQDENSVISKYKTTEL